MLSRLSAGRKKYGLKKFLVREANNQLNKMLYKSTRRTLVEAFRSLGVRGEMTVCAHASLSRLGYIEGGAGTVVDALVEAVGDTGCLVMPAFSMVGTMESYLQRGDTFDVRTTPSQVGAIAENFRLRPGVLRSVHPTNSLIALGPGAEELLSGHEDSLTPYGFATPYGKMVEDENAYILMINTHVQSLLHHIQERVDFPNLFLADEAQASCLDARGERRTVRTKIMRPRTPYFVAIPAASGSEPDWALLHDFSLMYPSRRDRTAAELGYRFAGKPELWNRRTRLIEQGILKSRAVGRGEVGLLNVKRFVESIQPEFEESIERFGAYYDAEKIDALHLAFG